MITDKVLRAFNKWFTSGMGVIQTFGITVGIVVVEVAFPGLDPHGFWLLFWLSVYSAVTQPALANAGATQSAQLAEVMSTVTEILKDVKLAISDEYVVDTKTYELLEQLSMRTKKLGAGDGRK